MGSHDLERLGSDAMWEPSYLDEAKGMKFRVFEGFRVQGFRVLGFRRSLKKWCQNLGVAGFFMFGLTKVRA